MLVVASLDVGTIPQDFLHHFRVAVPCRPIERRHSVSPRASTGHPAASISRTALELLFCAASGSGGDLPPIKRRPGRDASPATRGTAIHLRDRTPAPVSSPQDCAA